MRAFSQSFVLLITSPRSLDVLSTGFNLSPWALIVRTYLFDDWQFLGFLLTLIVVDTVTGVIRSWQRSQISSRGFSRFFTKVLVYLSLLVLAHVMTSFTIKGKVNVLFQWFDTFVYCVMMAREALSVLENLATMAPELVPKKLIKRLALFSEDPEAALPVIAPEPEPQPAPVPEPEAVEQQLAPTG
ncbi:bacteriophage holin [Hymenobacter sp. YC55]|uniref:bacteriophage holin n=1 Tax=Hymenobacter sp. YC55 TaxID=3034019 RepID=UPI0023F79D89|nr:bacteriophage holin [Hymenobacter sp. YC55]MDF7810749.1 bacteriophage holin [Hymenobacter sp. YC55]